jgi:pimeloyl-ACP methyl ester carboxylesterase
MADMQTTETDLTPGGPAVILVPGYWLGGWAWDAVAAGLRERGANVVAVTLPGLEPDAGDRGEVTWGDQVAELRRLIETEARPPVVVAHSGAGAVLSGVLDASPASVARAVYVDSGPAADGVASNPGLPAGLREIPLPSWAQLSAHGSSLAGLDDDQLATFRARAVPHPARVAREPVHLVNPERREVPTTIIACSIESPAMLELAQAGRPMFAEVARLERLDVIDLPTGHWPMWSRPGDLARLLAAAAAGQRAH